MSTVLLRLPDSLRGELKEPWGPVFEDAKALLAEAGDPIITVGDVVTYHLERAGRRPDVSLIDELTERAPVAEHILEAASEPDVTVENPAASLTEDLLLALREAVEADEPVRILVEGEEDLATLPAVISAPDGASVVYGQPGEGMVLVMVTPELRARASRFLRRLDGDVDATLEILV